MLHVLNADLSYDEIAQQVGCDAATVCRRLASFQDSEWFIKLVPRLEKLAPLAFANIAKALASGDYEATRDYLRGLRVYSERREHTGKDGAPLFSQLEQWFLSLDDDAKRTYLDSLRGGTSAKTGDG